MTNQFASTLRVRRKRALEAAGFVYVQGWVPFGPVAEIAQAEIERARQDVDAIINQPKKGDAQRT